MADIPVTLKEALRQHPHAVAAIERQIRSSNSSRKGDPLDSFNWKYRSAVALGTRDISVSLQATVRGFAWSHKLQTVPKVVQDYWNKWR